MAENSKIEWTDHTFNPWIGCTKVSPGCTHCYAETLMTRKPRWADTWGPRGTRIKTSTQNWFKPINWNKKAGAEGKRYKVFCGSLCDVFEWKDDQPELDDWRSELFGLIDQTQNLNWLLLTKRPENIALYGNWSNLWLGTSVENQEQADKRIPELIRITDVPVRFLSCEPLLGPINITGNPEMEVWPWAEACAKGWGIDWVIVGGESGPNRRPMNLDWARSIRDQCQAAGVPFFMKQVDKVQGIPDDLMIRQFPITETSHE